MWCSPYVKLLRATEYMLWKKNILVMYHDTKEAGNL